MSTACILAGGTSKRMGFDKQMLCVDEASLMFRHVLTLSQLFDDIMIISNNSLSNHLSGLPNVTIHQDILKHFGPLGGIHAALTYSSTPYVFVIACDMPMINCAYIDYMRHHLTDVDAVVTAYGDWIEPFHGYYNRSLIKVIEKYLISGRRNISGLLKKCETFYIKEEIARQFTPNWELFHNINTKDDLPSNYNDKNA